MTGLIAPKERKINDSLKYIGKNALMNRANIDLSSTIIIIWHADLKLTDRHNNGDCDLKIALIEYLDEARNGDSCTISFKSNKLSSTTMIVIPYSNSDGVVSWIGIALRQYFQDQSEILFIIPTLVKLVDFFSEAMDSNSNMEAELARSKEEIKRLARISEIDPLTRLENKRSFERRCKERLTNDSRPAALLSIDINDFKRVNDLYGHLFGDDFLICIANSLRAALPQQSIIGRIGGDEFCALIEIPENGQPYVQQVAHHLSMSARWAIATLGKTDLGGISTGISLYPEHGQSFEELLKHSDCALYDVKSNISKSYEVFKPHMKSAFISPNTKMQNGEHALDRITTLFQPIVDLESHSLAGLEILSRLKDQGGALQKPQEFSWLFKDKRCSPRLTAHILDTALEKLCIGAGFEIDQLPKLWLNVIDRDCFNSDFVFDIQTILSRYGVPWDKLVLEIREDTLVKPRDGNVLHHLRELKLRGGNIALDDFGAGHSGLNLLCQCPIDIVKIDQSIIQTVVREPSSNTMIEAIMLVAQRLGQVVVAEGVETTEQLRAAQNFNIDLAQGYKLAHPMSEKDIRKSMDFHFQSHDCALEAG